ncbi:proteinase inhibitor type-2 TR8-like [Ipomoea triloba]|uniref:proteinase inhibitor type-2 TR8-like n=1 Tax=Ipomoea triloba TaxID=35885 RepID=UPI00125DAA67|nr:proteinase inhibitor type-2 TR8-like [Ipomoea triloba]
MATTKLGFVTLLLLCGIVMVVKHANAQQMKPCTLECDGRAEYMICPYEQGSKVKQFQVAGSLCMNCCGAENLGCILFDQSGTPYCNEDRSFRSETKEMKPCTKECDGRAEYMICPRLQGSKMMKVGGSLCTNCCAAENMGCILLDENQTPYCHKEERSFIRKMAA